MLGPSGSGGRTTSTANRLTPARGSAWASLSVATPAESDTIRKEAKELVAEAARQALDAPRPDPREVTTACLHPGVVATAIGDRAGSIAGFGWRLIKPFLTSPEQGAATSLFLATVADPTPFHGAYVIGRRIAQPDSAARDDRLAEALWTESARLVGL